MSSVSSRAVPVSTVTPGSDPVDAERLRRLDALRAELDRVDDALHDLLMRRAEVVAQVGALGAKGRVPLRPGREASIIRRLLARNGGALAPATLVRVWREMLAGSSAQQSPMTIVAGDAGLEAAVREHFGALAWVETTEPVAAIERVRRGEAALAVLPFPSEEARWWVALVGEGQRWPRVHVVARLPFWARAGAVEALVLSGAAPDPSGHDRTLIAGAAPGKLEAAGLSVAARYPGGLLDIDGFVASEDRRLVGSSAVVLGAYAVPVGESE
ncbi:MAG: chorismate mutase [Acetobacteraceae bacterium]|nr:chorismate mutase [Acetobacteraceae bacterium]